MILENIYKLIYEGANKQAQKFIKNKGYYFHQTNKETAKQMVKDPKGVHVRSAIGAFMNNSTPHSIEGYSIEGHSRKSPSELPKLQGISKAQAYRIKSKGIRDYYKEAIARNNTKSKEVAVVLNKSVKESVKKTKQKYWNDSGSEVKDIVQNLHSYKQLGKTADKIHISGYKNAPIKHYGEIGYGLGDNEVKETPNHKSNHTSLYERTLEPHRQDMTKASAFKQYETASAKPDIMTYTPSKTDDIRQLVRDHKKRFREGKGPMPIPLNNKTRDQLGYNKDQPIIDTSGEN